mgnify:CR=1 FL=1
MALEEICAKIISTNELSKRKSKSRCKICTKGIYNQIIDRKKWKFNNSIIGILTLVVSRKCDIYLTNLHKFYLSVYTYLLTVFFPSNIINFKEVVYV